MAETTVSSHGQYIADPISHFKNIPWCAELLSDKRIVHIAVPDRRPKLHGEYTLVKETLNGASTVRACVTYFRVPRKQTEGSGSLQPTDDKGNPFVEISTLLDLGGGINGFAKTAHGGFLTTIFDEVMGTAAWQQSGDNGAYTVGMNLTFKSPLFTPAVIRCVGQVIRKEGRKITVAAKIVGADGKVHAEAEALFLEMKRNIGKAEEQKYGDIKSNL